MLIGKAGLNGICIHWLLGFFVFLAFMPNEESDSVPKSKSRFMMPSTTRLLTCFFGRVPRICCTSSADWLLLTLSVPMLTAYLNWFFLPLYTPLLSFFVLLRVEG